MPPECELTQYAWVLAREQRFDEIDIVEVLVWMNAFENMKMPTWVRRCCEIIHAVGCDSLKDSDANDSD
jgi:hypothetical protein